MILFRRVFHSVNIPHEIKHPAFKAYHNSKIKKKNIYNYRGLECEKTVKFKTRETASKRVVVEGWQV